MTGTLFKQTANFITAIRIILTCWMNHLIWFSDTDVNFFLLFKFAVIIGITDGLDGWVARKLKIESEFGGHFDKFADKYYACSLLSYFLQKDIISWDFNQIIFSLISCLIILILCIEVFLIVVWIIGFFKGIDTSPSKYGKWKMTFQFMAIAWLFVIKWLELQPEVNVLFSTYLGLIILLNLAAICGIFGVINYCQRYVKPKEPEEHEEYEEPE